MHDITFLDETLDVNQTNNYHISIQCQLNGFSFSVLDTLNNKYVALKNFMFQRDLPEDMYYEKVEDIVADEEFFSKKYKSSSLIYATRKITLLPDKFFDVDHLKNYFKLNHDLDELDELHYNRIHKTNIYSIYAVPNYIATTFVQRLPGMKFYSQITPMLFPVYSQLKQNKLSVRVNLNLDFLDIAVISSNKLILFNTFSFESESDIIYYLLLIYKKLNLKPVETELIVSGEIPKGSPLPELIKKFFKKVKYAKPNPEYTYSYTFSDIPSYTFVNLLNLHSCE